VKFPENYPAVLPVMEQFYTIQGEGAYTGTAAYFIRLAGCDVGCVWCDVKESWDVAAQQWMPVEDIVAEASKYPGKTIVITGGEPLMYDLTLLTEKLHEAGIRIHIETSGAYPLSGDIDWICVSPKKFKAPLPSVCSVAHELKIIVFNKSDFDWAEKYAKMVAPDCKLYLQPEWEKRAAVEPLMIDYVKNNPQWRMSVQTHKYLDIP
jgi:organic radical activating enzyme